MLPSDQIVTQKPFAPAWREDDHTAVYPHQSSLINAGDLHTINVPRGVNSILAQALDQDIRYALAGVPSQTSGFVLTADRDPIIIPIVAGRTTLTFTAEVDGAGLEMQFGVS